MSEEDEKLQKLGTLPTPIDRRAQGGKSHGNRERFLRRYKKQIKDAVKRVIGGKNIRDVGKDGADIPIDPSDTREYIFGHGQGGKREQVHPGNEEFITGDRIKRPGGGGGKGGKASDSGEGEDDFVFHINQKEFMDIFFDDCALPNLERTMLAETTTFKNERAGFTTEGTQNNLSIIHSMRHAKSRRLIFHSKERKLLLDKLDELQQLESVEHLSPMNYLQEFVLLVGEIRDLELKIGNDPMVEAKRPTLERIASIVAKMRGIPYLDPMDLRYRAHKKVPQPYSKAVMFCMMDVSGSMDEERKDISKRFFILLYLFLTRHYDKIDIVFIRHATEAIEVNEEDFFHNRESGGTIVSSALTLMKEIVTARYPSNEWNIYGAQASDGDNWGNDSGVCSSILVKELLPLCRYYAYIQVAREEQNLWDEYLKVDAAVKHFAMRKVLSPADIYPVFHDLFKKEVSE